MYTALKVLPMLKRKILPVCLGFLFTVTAPLAAATFTVQMLGGPNRFEPADLTINIGDTVRWVNRDPDRPHSSTSITGEWDSDLLFEDEEFSYTFDGAGEYQYYGSYAGMLGTITVVGAQNNPPTVTILKPTHGATFATSASFMIAASPSDTDGSVTSVEFYAGAILLGRRTGEPFSVTASNLAAGPYALTARAFDNLGLAATSAPVNVTIVRPVELRLQPPLMTGQETRIGFTTTPGLTYVLETASTLPPQWQALSTNVASSALTTATDPAGTAPRRFYRAYLAP